VVTPHSKKQIWELFRAAGTSAWEATAAPLLPVTGLKTWNEIQGE
jgi:hypothetical protein